MEGRLGSEEAAIVFGHCGTVQRVLLPRCSVQNLGRYLSIDGKPHLLYLDSLINPTRLLYWLNLSLSTHKIKSMRTTMARRHQVRAEEWEWHWGCVSVSLSRICTGLTRDVQISSRSAGPSTNIKSGGEG
jgi:hypothetical protein